MCFRAGCVFSCRRGRTSRQGGRGNGGGSWSHPVLRDLHRRPSAHISSAAAAASAASASSSASRLDHTLDAADNPTAYGLRENPYRNNWKATAPQPGHFSYADFQQHVKSSVLRERSTASSASSGEEGPTATTSHHGTASAFKTSWRGSGGPEDGSGAEDPMARLFQRGRPRTISALCRQLVDAAFEPRASDSKAFGGDGATERAQQRQELKHLDPRITPIFHEDLMSDHLRSVLAVHTPSGRRVMNGREALFKGRIVALLFFSETERSLAFMRELEPFHRALHPDVVVACISLASASKEMMELTTTGFGFYHITHRDGGATWVQRDVGLEMKLLMPLPRLVVLDGTSGREITRRGVTEVLSRTPEECLESWRQGCGCECSVWDFMRSWYLADSKN